jgi:thymidylate synthase (FAD)
MEKGFTIELPPHGYVRYIDHMGDDTRIVEAARVSYGAGSKGEEADKKLLKYLFTNRHTSTGPTPDLPTQRIFRALQ